MAPFCIRSQAPSLRLPPTWSPSPSRDLVQPIGILPCPNIDGNGDATAARPLITQRSTPPHIRQVEQFTLRTKLFQTSNKYPLLASFHLYHLSGSIARRLPGFCQHRRAKRANTQSTTKCDRHSRTNTTHDFAYPRILAMLPLLLLSCTVRASYRRISW